jgi:predicted nucleic acid-binding protein
MKVVIDVNVWISGSLWDGTPNAIAAKAEVLITGDLDLLVLQSVQEILILNPNEFLAEMDV